jgi:DNA-binding transcriptional regulator YiaG
VSPADVRAARERLGMTTQQLAEALECTVRTVQFWESGERNVPGPARVAMRLMLWSGSGVARHHRRAARTVSPAS